MIVDSSALVSISREEPGFESYLNLLLASPENRVSAATYLEAAIVVDRLPNPHASERFDELVQQLGRIIEPLSASQATIARRAYCRYGKGSGHPARLTFGACFAYALAKEREEPLLFIGQDFVHTDVRHALTAYPESDWRWLHRGMTTPLPAATAGAAADDPTIWRVDDALGARLEPVLRVDQVRKKPGRPRRDDRAIFAGLIWLARTGSQWSQLPRPCGPQIHRPRTVHGVGRHGGRWSARGRCGCGGPTRNSGWTGSGSPPTAASAKRRTRSS